MPSNIDKRSGRAADGEFHRSIDINCPHLGGRRVGKQVALFVQFPSRNPEGFFSSVVCALAIGVVAASNCQDDGSKRLCVENTYHRSDLQTPNVRQLESDVAHLETTRRLPYRSSGSHLTWAARFCGGLQAKVTCSDSSDQAHRERQLLGDDPSQCRARTE